MRVTCSSATPPRRQGGSPRRPTISSAGRPSCVAWKRCCTAAGWSRWSARAASARRGWRGAPTDQAAAGYRDGVCLRPAVRRCSTPSCCRTPSPGTSACPSSPGARSSTRSLTHLRDQSVLLVLDTCEHIIDACALFAEADHHRDARGHGARHQPRAAGRDRRELLHPPPRSACPDDDTPGQGATDAIELFALRAAAVRARVHGQRREQGRRDPAVPSARRHAARDRTGRRAAAGAAARASWPTGSTSGSTAGWRC